VVKTTSCRVSLIEAEDEGPCLSSFDFEVERVMLGGTSEGTVDMSGEDERDGLMTVPVIGRYGTSSVEG
jgi:hypothetical protein